MPTITISKKALKGYLTGKVSDSDLKEAISMLGTDLEHFGDEIKVEIFPNRPDLLSAPGLGRALNAFLGFEKKLRKYSVVQGASVVKILPSSKGVREHTRCMLVRNLKLNEEKIQEIIDIQEKLHVTWGRNRKKMAMGIYPLDKIDLPITFGAEKPEDIIFWPLEAQGQMNARQILEEHETGKKYASLLSDLKKYPVFRDAEKNVLSMPPIINSQETGRVDKSTTEAFVECSGHDEVVLDETIRMVACALIDMGATVETMTVDYGSKKVVSPNLVPTEMHIDKEYVCKRAGVPQKQLEKSLQKMGLELSGNMVTIPPYRVDFLHQVDVSTDAAIGFGYENVESNNPSMTTVGQLDLQYLLAEQVREVLVGMGMLEAKNYHISSTGVKLANSLTEEFDSLRNNILHQLLDTLQDNVSNSYPQSFYEIGTVFAKDSKKETGVRETEHLSVVQCGEQYSYTTIRKVLDALAHALEWKINYSAIEDKRFIPGRCAQVSGSIKGIIGEIHPSELASRGIKMPASGFEMSLPKL